MSADSLSAGSDASLRPWRPFRQTTQFRDFAPIALANALLGFVTLTLYRFWGRADMRRRVWSDLEVMGDPLE